MNFDLPEHMRMIDVGIPTAGAPVLEHTERGILLKNMLIGKDFHWQKPIEALLPGDVIENDDPVFRIINRLPIETYLECVVGSEMNPEAPAEFLKAHSVISRSWALGKIIGLHPDHARADSPGASGSFTGSETGAGSETFVGSRFVVERAPFGSSGQGKVFSSEKIINWEDTCDHKGFHVCSDDHCQRYQGIQSIRPEILDAIRSTAGMVLLSPEGMLVDTRFSKCCGGHTEVFASCWQDIDSPCLESFEDPWCNLTTLSEEERKRVLTSILKDYDLANGGGYRWHASVSAKEIEENLRKKFGREVGEVMDLEITARGASGRATHMKVYGTKGTIEIGKELMIRRILAPTHLYSSAITITRTSTGSSANTITRTPSESSGITIKRTTSGSSAITIPRITSHSGRGAIHCARSSKTYENGTFLHGADVTNEYNSQQIRMKGDVIFEIEGKGWGHGAGLCQIGAANMALHGHDFRSILSFYYPSSTLSNILPKTSKIR